MPSPKKPITAQNLEALGAARLAGLLVDIAAGDEGVRRRVRLALAGASGAAEVAKQVQQRLGSLARATKFLERRQVRPLADDMRVLHRTIADDIGKSDPRLALELMWRFAGLANTTFDRCDDSDGRLQQVFAAARSDMGPLAVAAQVSPETVAAQVFALVTDDGYEQFGGLISQMAEALGDAGLARVKQHFIAWGEEPLPEPAERRLLGFGPGGPFYADDHAARRRGEAARRGLDEIADLQNDVDAIIAQISPAQRKVPGIAAEIADRLLKAGRIDEARQAIEAVDPAHDNPRDYEWRLAQVDVLEALERPAEAQALRWKTFVQSLEPLFLRAYLKRLPDFDDVEAEDRAMAAAVTFPDVHRALHFLLEWPAPRAANDLVLARRAELNGKQYELLNRAAELLETRHPLAATLVRRAMIEDTLGRAQLTRYPHAARHLIECAGAATRIADYGPHPTSEAYLRRLMIEHGAKRTFWQMVEADL
jgi:hypothetical protein